MLPDGGICPQGRHLQGTVCIQDLSHTCMSIPTACNGAISCACAATALCGEWTCNVLSAGEMTCIQAVP
jgi:hypothetical protein